MADHDCIRSVNEQLAPHNTRIASAISFSTPARELIQVVTCKAEPSVRGKPVVMFASHCPFCGVKLATGSAS